MTVRVVRPRKSILSRPIFSMALHVVGGDDGVVLGAGDGDEFGERLGRDDDAGGVDACAADEAFEAECGVDELLDLRVAVVGGGEGGP